MTFEESLHYMQGLMRFGWKLGNERFEVLMARLGDPQRRYPVIHVAGTKGKGSTTAMAAAILRECGYRVGGYFSPYVYDVRERVQINGEPIAKADFARLVSIIRSHVEELALTPLGQTTEFELKTALAFLAFAEAGVEWACVEVGLGGRLDATNVVAPDVTVITNIGLDHTNILGDTHALIAAEKAGIIKPGVVCFTAARVPEALEVIRAVAAERGAELILVDAGAGRRTNESGEADAFAPVDIRTERAIYRQIPLRMGGAYQAENAACAVAAVERALADRGITLSEDAVRRALAATALPGRLSLLRLPDGPLVVMDGAHNELAARSLADTVQQLMRREGIQRLLMVIGMVNGHEPGPFLAALAPAADALYACAPNWRRALPAEEIGAEAARCNQHVTVIERVPEALCAALKSAGPADMILITGSFYTVGEVPPDWISEQWQHLKAKTG